MGRLMFKGERKQDEQKETLSNGDKKRIKEIPEKDKGRHSGKEPEKVLEPLRPLFS